MPIATIRPTELTLELADNASATLEGNSFYVGKWRAPRAAKAQVVAVHVFDETVLHDSIRQHVEACKNLSHPNVSELLGVSSRDADPGFLVGELYPWRNVMEYLVRKPDGDRARLILEVAMGMSYLHLNGLIHGSLHPANVLIKDDGSVCVSDCGIIHLRPSRNGNAHQYLSPEAWTGVLSRPADVYAYAMTAFEIFSGSPPWGESAAAQVYRQVIHQDKRPSFPDSNTRSQMGLTDRVTKIIEDSWKLDPYSRPTFDKIVDLCDTHSSAPSGGFYTPSLKPSPSSISLPESMPSSLSFDKTRSNPPVVPLRMNSVRPLPKIAQTQSTVEENDVVYSPEPQSVPLSPPPAYPTPPHSAGPQPYPHSPVEQSAGPPPTKPITKSHSFSVSALRTRPLPSPSSPRRSTTDTSGQWPDSPKSHSLGRASSSRIGQSTPALVASSSVFTSPGASSSSLAGSSAHAPVRLEDKEENGETKLLNFLELDPCTIQTGSGPRGRSPGPGSFLNGLRPRARSVSGLIKTRIRTVSTFGNLSKAGSSMHDLALPDAQTKLDPQSHLSILEKAASEAGLTSVSDEEESINTYLVHLRQDSESHPPPPAVIPAIVELLKTRSTAEDGLDIVVATLGTLARDIASANIIHDVNPLPTLIDIWKRSSRSTLLPLIIWSISRIGRTADIANTLIKGDIARLLFRAVVKGPPDLKRSALWCIGSLTHNDALAEAFASGGAIVATTEFLSKSEHPDDLCAGFYALARLSRSHKLAKALCQVGCVAVLATQLAESQDSDVLNWAARAVGCLMRPSSGDLAKMLVDGGIPEGLARLPDVLSPEEVTPLSSFAFAIQRFSCAEWGGGTRKALTEAGVVEALLSAFRTVAERPCPQVHIDLALAVSQLGDVGGGRVRKEVVNAGGLQILENVAAMGNPSVQKACSLAITTLTGNILKRNAASARTAMSHDWSGGCPVHYPPCPLSLT